MPQIQHYSTDRLPPRARMAYWNDITSRALTPQVADPLDRDAFAGRMACLDLGDVRLVEVDASGSTVTHSRAQACDARQPAFLVRLALGGEITALQEGRAAQLQAGDFTLCDCASPYELRFDARSHVLVLRVARDRLLPWIGEPEAFVGVHMPGAEGLSGFASRQLRDLWATAPQFLAQGAAGSLLELTLQYLSVAYGEAPGRPAAPPEGAAPLRARALAYVDAHLADADLGPARIAAHLRISTGYLHRLFRGETATLSRRILQKRLDACARALRDPRQANRDITSIALSMGFESLPHFSRAFRARHGASPREWRRGTRPAAIIDR